MDTTLAHGERAVESDLVIRRERNEQAEREERERSLGAKCRADEHDEAERKPAVQLLLDERNLARLLMQPRIETGERRVWHQRKREPECAHRAYATARCVRRSSCAGASHPVAAQHVFAGGSSGLQHAASPARGCAGSIGRKSHPIFPA